MLRAVTGLRYHSFLVEVLNGALLENPPETVTPSAHVGQEAFKYIFVVGKQFRCGVFNRKSSVL